MFKLAENNIFEFQKKFLQNSLIDIIPILPVNFHQ